MMSKLPQIFTGSRISIICEGDEEYEYLEKLISLDVWSKEYCFQLENAADQIVIYGNPCTMQIIIEHWDDVVLGSHKKNKNAPIIFDLTGIEGYKGRADQRQALFSRFTKENYQEMRERIKKLPSDDTIEGSTNFGRFIEYFTMDDSKWIQTINNTLDG